MSEQIRELCNSQAHAEQPAAEPKTDQPSQEELRVRYLEQQRRMRCVGCGESEEFF